MSKRKNVFTRIGRPPIAKVHTAPLQPLSGERQGRAPTDGLDTALPASAFKRGGQAMPRYHDDPSFCSGGPARRR